MIILRIILLTCLLGLTVHAQELSLTPAAVFADNAVLQQGIEVPVWGTSAPKAEISVEFRGQTHRAVANDAGNWRVTLSPLKATALATLDAAPKGDKLIIQAKQAQYRTQVGYSGILVGEVWLCSGQSNMAGKVRHNPVEDKSDNLIHSNYPAVRHSSGEGTWLRAVKGEVNNMTRVGFCFARELHRELKVPIGLVHVSVGGSSIESWMRTRPDTVPERMNRGKPVSYGKHYEMLLAPLIGYGIRGAIWYQGEANASEGQVYADKMTAMITDWRKSWKQGEFPFYYVQIAAIGTSPEDNPAMGDGRARIREAQRRVLALKNTGMATAIENGGPKEHPQNKKEVGVHLAQWALNRDYERAEVVPCGPLYKSHTVEGATIRIKFDYAKGLMKANRERFQKPVPAPDAKLPWLSIQAADGSWHWATATIDGSDLLVSSPEVKKPQAVRYAYTNRPLGVYLYNAAGLPAVPFTTEAEIPAK